MKDKSQKYFVDSNIWLYAFIKSNQNEDKTKIANSIITSVNIVISTQVINEVCVNLIKKAKFTEEKIQELGQDFYLNYQVVDFEPAIFRKASQLRQNYSLSYWDSLIVACALVAEAETLYSEDMQNGLVIDKALTIINPFQNK
ncbi:MAG: PIN domain-containing protein [Xenococcaceae cyanobacterium]